MKINKKLGLLLSIPLFIALYFFNQPAQIEEPQEIVQKGLVTKVEQGQKAIISSAVREENKNLKALDKFISLSFDPKTFLKDPDVNEAGARKFVEETYVDLKKCYREGCGQKADEEDGFYDPALTVAMTSMKRLLEVAIHNPEEIEAKEWLGLNELKDMLNVPSEDVRKLALKNMMNLHRSNKEVFNEVLRANDNLDGMKAADLMGELMHYVDDSNKAAFIGSLEMIAKEKDAYTANKVLRKTQELKVGKEEIESIASELCRFKKDSFNFNGLNYSLKNMATGSGHQFILKDYCR